MLVTRAGRRWIAGHEGGMIAGHESRVMVDCWLCGRGGVGVDCWLFGLGGLLVMRVWHGWIAGCQGGMHCW